MWLTTEVCKKTPMEHVVFVKYWHPCPPTGRPGEQKGTLKHIVFEWIPRDQPAKRVGKHCRTRCIQLIFIAFPVLGGRTGRIKGVKHA